MERLLAVAGSDRERIGRSTHGNPLVMTLHHADPARVNELVDVGQGFRR
jgi:hypothetical protein